MANLYVISGVTGMTGNETARQLLKAGHKVIGFDNFFASSIQTVRDLLGNENFEFLSYDINDKAQMRRLKEKAIEAKGSVKDIVYVNCAAVVHTEHFYHIDRTFETNVLGMRDFLGQAIDVGARIYINCSTSEVYSMASWKEGGVRESDFITMANAEHSQRTSYAAGKLLTEFFMRDAVDRGLILGCSIRFANVYSRNELYPKHIIPHILTQLSEKGGVELLENARVSRRTFLHNADSCSAIIKLAESRDALDGSIYNVATDEEVSILELVDICAGKLGIQNPIITFKGYRESDPERRLLNTEKIRGRTGWVPSVTLDEGIGECVEELRK